DRLAGGEYRIASLVHAHPRPEVDRLGPITNRSRACWEDDGGEPATRVLEQRLGGCCPNVLEEQLAAVVESVNGEVDSSLDRCIPQGISLLDDRLDPVEGVGADGSVREEHQPRNEGEETSRLHLAYLLLRDGAGARDHALDRSRADADRITLERHH